MTLTKMSLNVGWMTVLYEDQEWIQAEQLSKNISDMLSFLYDMNENSIFSNKS